jgi:predicted nucleic acid-binding protein
MPAADVICDAGVALKWFRSEGEEEVGESRALLEGQLTVAVLDLTRYEIGNALIRGLGLAAANVAVVLESLDVICPSLTPTAAEMADALTLAELHHLTVYDAIYAAVARARNARLATLDRLLLAAGLGSRPSELIAHAS